MINDYSPTMAMDDASLSKQGRETLSQLMKEHYNWALTHAGSCGARQDAEDIVHDAFVALATRQSDGDFPGRALVSVVIYHRVVDRYRKRSRAPLVELYGDLVEDGSGLSTAARRARTVDDIRDALRRLQTLPRVVIEMRYFDELNSSEIGRRLSLPDSTVRGILRRALGLLRQELGVVR